MNIKTACEGKMANIERHDLGPAIDRGIENEVVARIDQGRPVGEMNIYRFSHLDRSIKQNRQFVITPTGNTKTGVKQNRLLFQA